MDQTGQIASDSFPVMSGTVDLPKDQFDHSHILHHFNTEKMGKLSAPSQVYTLPCSILPVIAEENHVIPSFEELGRL